MTNLRNDADGLPGFSFQAVDGQEIVEPSDAALRPSETNTPQTARSARNTLIAAMAAYIAFNLLLPLVPYHPRVFRLPFSTADLIDFSARIAAFKVAPTALFMFLQLWLARSLVALRWNNRQAGAVALGAVVVWLAVFVFGNSVRHFTRAEAGAYAAVSPLLYSLALTVGLTAFGVLLSKIVREPNVLLPVALVAMPIDLVGAMTSIGFTSNVVRHAPKVVSSVSVHVPHVGGLSVFALIGPGDALFIAFFLAAVQRLDMNLRGTFWWMFGLLTLAIAEVIVFGYPIGALVPMGIAVIAANWRYIRLKRAEIFAVVYAVLIIFGLALAFFLVTARHFGK